MCGSTDSVLSWMHHSTIYRNQKCQDEDSTLNQAPNGKQSKLLLLECLAKPRGSCQESYPSSLRWWIESLILHHLHTPEKIVSALNFNLEGSSQVHPFMCYDWNKRDNATLGSNKLQLKHCHHQSVSLQVFCIDLNILNIRGKIGSTHPPCNGVGW